METLNEVDHSDVYREIIRTKDLVIGDRFPIKSIFVRKTQFGERVVVRTLGDRELYLPARMLDRIKPLIDSLTPMPNDMFIEFAGKSSLDDHGGLLYKFYKLKSMQWVFT